MEIRKINDIEEKDDNIIKKLRKVMKCMKMKNMHIVF